MLSHWPFLVVLATMACAPLTEAPSIQLAGTPSATGCDAWFEIGGTFARVNNVQYTLKNRPANPSCVATRVQVLFHEQLSPAAFRVSMPPAWTSLEVRCPSGVGSCGFEWRARGVGILPGQELGGFGLAYDPARAPRPRSWIVEVGRRRVEMPIGNVGG